ncbi:MAG: endoribonuclease MazF [Tannerella sp.]|jgi:mRNA interferase MazF|nr:endoribonuclease MazF [Tannerella sp.]
MVMTNYIPDRGDIVWLDFAPQTGHEQQGKRPAVVLSPQTYNQKSKLALLCPITTKQKGYPFEVQIESEKVKGVVLSDQLKSLDWQQRGAVFIDKASEAEMNEIIKKLSILIFL